MNVLRRIHCAAGYVTFATTLWALSGCHLTSAPAATTVPVPTPAMTVSVPTPAQIGAVTRSGQQSSDPVAQVAVRRSTARRPG